MLPIRLEGLSARSRGSSQIKLYDSPRGRKGPRWLLPRKAAVVAEILGRLSMTQTRRRGSIRLEAGELDHLPPLFGFVGDELAEIGRRARKDCAANFS
jgi:hypothetical protein